jgi:hypothetical protein
VHPSTSGSDKSTRRVRVRSRPLSEIDEAKLALAVFMMARRLLETEAQKAGAGSTSDTAALNDREVA